MTPAELKAFVAEHITYKDWTFYVHTAGPIPYLQVHFKGTCSVTGNTETQKGRKWLLSHHMTPSEVVGTCWLAVQRAELHEAAEVFHYKGVAIYNPHQDVEVLVDAATQEDRRQPHGH